MTKDRILKVASQEFSKYGYDGVSMNNLVKKLDINKATVYYHYKDKKSLYLEVMKTVIKNMNEKTRLIFKENLDSKEFLYAYIKVYAKSIQENPYLPGLALREIASLGSDIDESLIPLFDEDVRYLRMTLDKLDIKEKYKDIDDYAFHSLIMGTIFTFYSIQMSPLDVGTKDELKNNDEKSLDYISSFVSNLLLDSICK